LAVNVFARASCSSTDGCNPPKAAALFAPQRPPSPIHVPRMNWYSPDALDVGALI
jgi:hypothetical protein